MVIVHLGKLQISKSCALSLTLQDNTRTFNPNAFALQHIIARMLLQQYPNFGLCAFPLRDISKVVVVGPKASLEPLDSILEYFFKEHQITVDCARPLDNFTLESALLFSIPYFLETANWIKAGNFLMPSAILSAIQPRETVHPRVKCDVQLSTDGDIYVEFSFDKVRIFPIEPLRANNESQFDERTVFALPRLGCGRVVSVHRGVPASAPFAGFAELRHYWKLTYGYDLPATPPECYYEVMFNGMQRPYLYPSYLVWSRKPENVTLIQNDAFSKQISEIFFNDFLSACGERFIVDFKMHPTLCETPPRIQVSIAQLSKRKQRNVPQIGRYRPNTNFFTLASDMTSEEEQNPLEHIEVYTPSESVKPPSQMSSFNSLKRKTNSAFKPVVPIKRISLAAASNAISQHINENLKSELETVNIGTKKRPALELSDGIYPVSFQPRKKPKLPNISC